MTAALGQALERCPFLIAAVSVVVYLTLLRDPLSLQLGGALWGFMITASVAWAPWMSELYPAHVRSSAMSIFNWGRIISMTVPLVTGAIAEQFGLESAMLTSALGFGLAGIVWVMLPETVVRKDRAA